MKDKKKYMVARTRTVTDYANVIATSEKEAVEKAIEESVWAEGASDETLKYNYIAVETVK